MTDELTWELSYRRALGMSFESLQHAEFGKRRRSPQRLTGRAGESKKPEGVPDPWRGRLSVLTG